MPASDAWAAVFLRMMETDGTEQRPAELLPPAVGLPIKPPARKRKAQAKQRPDDELEA